MTAGSSGKLSHLIWVQMHGRVAEYLEASDAERSGIVELCRREGTLPDLAERILKRTIYAQSSARVGPLRELVQNALDASSRGSRIDVRLSHDGRELLVADRGRGMRRRELLQDLLVPFRSGKDDLTDAIGEHGIGFFSALELAPYLEVSTTSADEAWQLAIEPLGAVAPYADFRWTLRPLVLPPTEGRRPRPTGTSVRLRLAQRVSAHMLWVDLSAAAGFVDPSIARIYLNDTLTNTARARMRRVARGPIEAHGGELELFIGRGEGIEPQITLTHAGLLVGVRHDAFAGPGLGLHRELSRAIVGAGFGIVADLPANIPLNKSRSAVAAHAASAVDRAFLSAFERFVLEDALFDRELLRAVDHRLGSVLDRLVTNVLLEEPATEPSPTAGGWIATGPGMPPEPAHASLTANETSQVAPDAAANEGERVPTVAAPEEVVRFAHVLVDTPLFRAVTLDERLRERSDVRTLREILSAYRNGALRIVGEPPAPGNLYLAITDPLSDALWRRLSTSDQAPAPVPTASGDSLVPRAGAHTMPRISRPELLAAAGWLRGVDTLAAAMTLLERIDDSISTASRLERSPILVHQDLYGPDEMAHTDGRGISVNLASQRVRGLLVAALACADAIALAALVDLLVHEKTHVALASFVPRATAEHGTSFYRRKDQIRRRLFEALAIRTVADPALVIPALRASIGAVVLPAPDALAGAVAALAAAA